MAKRKKKAKGESSPLSGGRKRVLMVLFIPASSATGRRRSISSAGSMRRGRLFGGATAYPRAQGVWRDDERGGALIRDEPVLIHCYMKPEDIEDSDNLAALGSFCRRLGREAKQGEVGLVVGNEYFAIQDFEED